MDRHQITELFRDTWGQHSENRTIAYMECCEGIFDCMEWRFCLAQRGFIVPSSNPDHAPVTAWLLSIAAGNSGARGTM